MTISGPRFHLKRGGAPSRRKDQLDLAGQAILSLLEKAADAAEANSRRAAEATQQLSAQLQAAENRIAKLEAENQLYRDRSGRAEEWLRRIYSEIQESFIENADSSVWRGCPVHSDREP
jgi:DNA repair exonuclease SbcCD ATPase subunit